MYHFQKRILAYRMSEVVPAKLILLVSLTGIFPTACVFEYNSSVVSPSMTYSTLNSSMVSRDSVLNGREALCLSFWCRQGLNQQVLCLCGPIVLLRNWFLVRQVHKCSLCGTPFLHFCFSQMCFKAYCVSVKVKKQNQNSKYHHEFADSVKVDTKLQKGQFQKVIEI